MLSLDMIDSRVAYIEEVFKTNIDKSDFERLTLYIGYTNKAIVELLQTDLDNTTKSKLYSLQQTVFNYNRKLALLKKEDKKSDAPEGQVIARIFTVLGILGFILAGIYCFYMTWDSMSDALKGILVSMLGLTITGIGSRLCIKSNNKFNQSIISVGVSLLYVAIGLSTIYLGVINSLTAIILCMIVSVGVFVIASKFDSQIIATFALLGGYLPLLKINSMLVSVGLICYLGLFSVLTFIFIVSKRWNILCGVVYAFSWIVVGIVEGFAHEDTPVLGFSYCLFVFILNTLFPLVSSVVKRRSLSTYDFVLINCNTFIGAILLSVCTSNLLSSTLGVIAFVLLGVGYILFGVYLDIFSEDNIKYKDYFIIVGITLIAIAFLLATAIGWLCLVGILECTVLLLIGYFTDKDSYKRMASYFYIVTCLLFEMHTEGDVPAFWSDYGGLISQLLIIALGVLYIWVMTKSVFDLKLKVIANITVFVSVLFTMIFIQYIVNKFELISGWDEIVDSIRDNHGYYIDTFITFIAFAISGLYLHSVHRVLDKRTFISISVFGLLYTAVITFMLFIAYLCGELTILARQGFLSIADPRIGDDVSSGVYFLCMITHLLVTFGMVMFAKVFLDSLNCFTHSVSKRVRTFVLSAVCLVAITGSFGQMYRLQDYEVYTSVICITFGVLWVIKGFKLHFTGMRYTGLTLSFIFIIKLLFDIRDLSANIKPIIYVLVALLCFGIGYAYTYLSKKASEEVIDDMISERQEIDK